MSKRDEVAQTVCNMTGCAVICPPCRTRADAILALLSDPDDRMVEAAITAVDGMDLVKDGLHAMMRAAIRAAMKAAGE